MAYESLGKSIAEGTLIRALVVVAPADVPQGFAFERRLVDFAERISAEVEFIKVTFPEFTDHTAAIHFPNLFRLADVILGEALIQQLHAEELFILVAGLYAHDWGMAVSAGEKEFILTGKGAEENPDELWGMNHERERFLEFARESDIALNAEGFAPDLPAPYWREYVRRTHAERSADRAQRWFEKIDGGIAQSVAALCRGHWLDLEAIDAEHEFPAHLNVLNQRINLRALALFIRIVDLFDIAEDRTPYAIWRFVSPRDPRSQREWHKHRALRPVNTEPYPPTRCLVVDGTASDPDTYADLVDLRDYCEKQLRGTCDLLARHHDPRLPFDLAPILHWRVKAQGFTPSEIRFEFERSRMFEILGGEIYQGDCCVFLRELLQNSIDAIRLLRALQQKAPRQGVISGLIHFQVTHEPNGDCLVRCTDNGAGMDDYIVRHYLSVAGRSYYDSHDFTRLGLSLDPISRFGIGLLSCFLVADHVEILTRRDPKISRRAEAMRLEIVHPERQWRVYPAPPDTDVGTTVTVRVRGERLTKNTKEHFERLPVTEYLAAIAGFVEFPILIEENDSQAANPLRRSVVVHPDESADNCRTEFGSEIEVHQLQKGFPFEETVSAEDLELAREHFCSDTLDIAADMKVTGCGGFVTAFRLKDETHVLREANIARTGKKGIQILSSPGGASVVECLGIKQEATSYNERLSGLTRSADRGRSRSVYVNGILVPNTQLTNEYRDYYNGTDFPVPIVRINFLRNTLGPLSISRLEMKEGFTNWAKQLKHDLKGWIERIEAPRWEKIDDWPRACRLANRALSLRFDPSDLASLTVNKKPTFCVLEENGSLNVRTIEFRSGEEIPLVPDPLSDQLMRAGFPALLEGGGRKSNFLPWKGGACLFSDYFSETPTHPLAFICPIAMWNGFEPIRLQFLSPPHKSHLILVQQVFRWSSSMPKGLSPEMALQGLHDPPIIPPLEMPFISLGFSPIARGVARAVPFATPFVNFVAVGSEHWNRLHPTTLALQRVFLAHWLQEVYQNPIPSPTELAYLLENALSFSNSCRDSDREISWSDFWKLAATIPGAVDSRSPSLPTREDFIPGTSPYDFDPTFRNVIALDRPFGQLINEWPCPDWPKE
ncbi:MAG TPA: hypothetical protein VGW39_03815 [Chthoniobacterales bacterium]|nr:hypothetical protein [Chthoniobacterales bacterium]